ncbi:uncharacterized protein LOC126982782 [Eriocheir sinensis]|uniref:uncharacterized protein LOC126982782 n=1 Tax=Eriocheir sinensis TaxID=95602 RepID=UPI0021C63B87|nr:uncharacterized protein LOC126982782 [Eriocheir sinensis]
MTQNSLRILSANVRGFRTNVGELTHAVLRNRADVMVAVETFLNDECVTTCDRIPGYCHWERRDRKDRQGGGVALQPLSAPVAEHMEDMFFRLLLADMSAVLLVALYRPQWQGSEPLTFLTDQLDTILATYDCQSTAIVGDMNQHMVSRAFTELTVVHGLTNHVTFPTHVRGGSLDLVLTGLPGDSVYCRPLERIGSSDHNAVLTELGLNPSREEARQRVIWLWQRADWQAMKRALAGTDWDATLRGDVDHNVSAFSATLLQPQRQHVPHRAYKADPRDQPWFGYRCRLATEKYSAWRQYKRRPSQRNKALHRAACKAMTRTAAWARKRWGNSLRRKLASNQVDPKQWWSLVKERHGTITQDRIPPLKTPAGGLEVKNQDKADLATHFTSKMTVEEPDRHPPLLPRLGNFVLENLVITEGTVAKHLRDTNTRKPPGTDDISPFQLKHCAGELSHPLTRIFRQCLSAGISVT